ncbi:hypothetical protein ACFQL7_20575 [Halocatena marina]|uniref:Uncharacterized protein n=1 Tax=Halocatena marina TaxID=2934937 RepID=A0ABD5YW27_9EURY|nr:hypothetical protein [Halocatena marina]
MSQMQTQNQEPVETIPRVGEKTAETLNRYGYHTAKEVVTAYLDDNGEEIADLLYSENAFLDHLLEMRPSPYGVVNRDLGIHFPEYSPIGTEGVECMLFARKVGLGQQANNDVPNTKLKPSDINWNEGIVQNSSGTFGLVYDAEKLNYYKNINISKISDRIQRVWDTEDMVVFKSDGQSFYVGKETLEEVNSFAQTDYQICYDYVTVDTDKESFPLLFKQQHSELPILCAPWVLPEQI